MRHVTPNADWPESWRASYQYDLLEVFGGTADPSYTRKYRERQNRALQAIRDSIAPPARVLDVAAAQGNFSLHLAEEGYDVTWNDLRDDLAGYVEAKRERGDITYSAGNLFELPAGEFDAVLITEIIEHVAHPDEFLRHVANLVRPGGFVIMTTPNGAYIRNKLPRFSDCPDPSVFETDQFKPDSSGHIFLLYEDEVRRFAADSGLTVERIEFFTNLLTAGHMKTERLARLLPVQRIERCTARRRGSAGRLLNTQMLAVLRRRTD